MEKITKKHVDALATVVDTWDSSIVCLPDAPDSKGYLVCRTRAAVSKNRKTLEELLGFLRGNLLVRSMCQCEEFVEGTKKALEEFHREEE